MLDKFGNPIIGDENTITSDSSPLSMVNKCPICDDLFPKLEDDKQEFIVVNTDICKDCLGKLKKLIGK